MSFVPRQLRYNDPVITFPEWRRDSKGRLIAIDVAKLIDDILESMRNRGGNLTFGMVLDGQDKLTEEISRNIRKWVGL